MVALVSIVSKVEISNAAISYMDTYNITLMQAQKAIKQFFWNFLFLKNRIRLVCQCGSCPSLLVYMVIGHKFIIDIELMYNPDMQFYLDY